MAPLESKTHVPTLTAAQALAAPGATIIDLRSPGEFAEDHLPGAHNVPLFDDVERAVVGTLYARHSPARAFDRGRELVLERIESLVREVGGVAGWSCRDTALRERVERFCAEGIAGLEGVLEVVPSEVPEPGAVILHCWRGGLRSRSVIALLREVGLESAVGLQGGYKAYRTEVRAQLACFDPPPVFVLRGLTGVGKTLVLRELERQRPGWTLDLEGCAGHRSSILGMVGLEPCGQKTFESRLATRIRAGFPGVCVMEGESRRVGDRIVPAAIWNALRGGTSLELVASTPRRVEVLLEDYLEQPDNRAELRGQLAFIEQRLGPVKWHGALTAMLDAGREAELVEVLLSEYYDPLYRHSEKGIDYAERIDTTDPAKAARDIASWIEAAAPS